MSISYRSSILFSQPFHRTISNMEVQDMLYDHKRKLQINVRSVASNNNYKTQRLSLSQAKTIENLSRNTRIYSLNKILKTFNKAYEVQRPPQIKNKNLNQPYLISEDKLKSPQFICTEKLKLFTAGVNYRSKQRARGAGVKKINIEDLKQYNERCPQQQTQESQINAYQTIRRFNTIDYTQNNSKSKSRLRIKNIQTMKSFK